MSSTPYRDELLRIIAWAGLPDDTDPTTVADHLAANFHSPADQRELALAINTERTQCAIHAATIQQARDLGAELRVRAERAGTGQAYSDMADIAARLAAL